MQRTLRRTRRRPRPRLFVKPRNTLLATGPAGMVRRMATVWQVGVSLGIVIGRTACRVAESDAASVVAGYT